MNVLWTLINILLYTEMVAILLLVLPMIYPHKWKRLFTSKLPKILSRQAYVYILPMAGVQVLLIIDAMDEVHKYASYERNGEAILDMKIQHSLRLFHAQRNFNISGFSMFLVLIIRRLVALMYEQSKLMDQSETSLKQAQNAVTAARSPSKIQTFGEFNQLSQRIRDLGTGLTTEQKDKKALQWQAEHLNKEFDSLTEDYNILVNQIKIDYGGGDKTGISGN